MRKQKILFFIIIGAAISFVAFAALVAFFAPYLQRQFGPPDLNATVTVVALRSTEIAIAATEAALIAPLPPTATSSTIDPILTGEKTWNGLHIQVTDVQQDAWYLIQAYNHLNDPPLPGNRMLLITLNITAPDHNKENAPVAVQESDFKVVGDKKEIYTTYGEETRCGVIPGQLGGVVSANFSLTGSICVQVPENEGGFSLIYESYLGDQPAVYISLPE